MSIKYNLIDTIPYLFRRCNNEKVLNSNKSELLLVGASVAENQLCNGESVTVPNGHKYYLKKSGAESIGASTGTAITGLTSGSDMVIDLTQMLGSAIADYLYTIEQTTAGAGVAKLREWGFLTGEYIPHNTGSLESVEATAHKMVGFNQWDEEWEVGEISNVTGQNVASTSRSRAKNYINVSPYTTYYHSGADMAVSLYDADKNFISQIGGFLSDRTFVTPSNCYYIRFFINSPTMPDNICINISSDRNGEYEPYSAHTYNLGTDTLRGLFKLDSNNNLYADGDTKTSDGTVTRKYGVVDLGTLTWTYDATYADFSAPVVRGMVQPSVTAIPNIINAKYTAIAYDRSTTNDKVLMIGRTGVNYIRIKDTAYTDAATFKEAMSGVMLVYELATPTTEQSTPFQSPQICYPDGTEQFVTETDVPVGHKTRYYYIDNNSIIKGHVLNYNGLQYLWTKLKSYFSKATNLVNGSATGSLRSIGSDEESNVYTIGQNAVAEGSLTRASGNASHAEGATTIASNYGDHAEGVTTFATGSASHSEGSSTYASGVASHAQNYGTKASSDYQTALGKYNIEDSNDTYAVIIGNGASDSMRSNALTVDWSGNVTANDFITGNTNIGNTNISSIGNGTVTGAINKINIDINKLFNKNYMTKATSYNGRIDNDNIWFFTIGSMCFVHGVFHMAVAISPGIGVAQGFPQPAYNANVPITAINGSQSPYTFFINQSGLLVPNNTIQQYTWVIISGFYERNT